MDDPGCLMHGVQATVGQPAVVSKKFTNEGQCSDGFSCHVRCDAASSAHCDLQLAVNSSVCRAAMITNPSSCASRVPQ